ncbi:DNA-binding response regulator, OmpR family, contains REC and winged-helix (wHTH) domain [Chitinophaga rupis]|uniref:DNA-binding response regulator, OmpR family, contains REC and winged-helix (WHTH) domain n=1 Tax=Chitinophaga rupis TaxID=573321 RepID=A0A1H8EE52_9BACT|nr:response regulator transcription factor [Chitinophaga rupis]SEN17038.1 DNA-binding response regulator, OmpR family, contains REC and winged-helix (wHTH) domain [Chitinophaga rupis]
MKILIIEDEIQLVQSISEYLQTENYTCEYALTYRQAVHKVLKHNYDCILLDLMLPGGDGMQILEEMKRLKKMDGVIIISARGAFEDKISGLQIGADDYLSKPFHLPELAARIYSVVRRRNFGNSNIIDENELQINLLAKTATINNVELSLTKKEFDLLLYFISNRNCVISKNALAEHLSGDIAGMLDNYDYIYAHIKNLKKKLNDAGCRNYLKTIYGSGYKWEI